MSRPEKVRESYEQALEAAREAGLEDAVRPLVELRLADLDAPPRTEIQPTAFARLPSSRNPRARESQHMGKMQKYLAEALGTFTLVGVGSFAIISARPVPQRAGSSRSPWASALRS